MCVALIIDPWHTELDLTLWIYESFKHCVTSELFFVSINDRTNGIKHFTYCLMKFGLTRIFFCYLLDYFIYI